MELIGRVIDVKENVRTGVSRNGAGFHIDEFVLEGAGQFPDSLKLEVYSEATNDKWAQWKSAGLRLGAELRVHYSTKARKSDDGMWFNSIRAFRVDVFQNANQQYQQYAPQMSQQQYQQQYQQPAPQQYQQSAPQQMSPQMHSMAGMLDPDFR